MDCVICTHPKRKEIEQELLLRNFGDSDVTFKTLADMYNVPIKDLKIHALMHTTVEYEESVVDKIKLKEAGILQDTIKENFTTLKNLGNKINKIINAHEIDDPTLGQLTKNVVELYLGCSQVIKDTTDSLIKMNISVNGDQNSGAQALADLVSVIRGKDGN